MQLICLIGIKDDHLIGYKKTILERQSFSEVNTALLRFNLQKCHKKEHKNQRIQMVEQFKKNVLHHNIVKTFNISLSTLH